MSYYGELGMKMRILVLQLLLITGLICCSTEGNTSGRSQTDDLKSESLDIEDVDTDMLFSLMNKNPVKYYPLVIPVLKKENDPFSDYPMHWFVEPLKHVEDKLAIELAFELLSNFYKPVPLDNGIPAHVKSEYGKYEELVGVNDYPMESQSNLRLLLTYLVNKDYKDERVFPLLKKMLRDSYCVEITKEVFNEEKQCCEKISYKVWPNIHLAKIYLQRFDIRLEIKPTVQILNVESSGSVCLYERLHYIDRLYRKLTLAYFDSRKQDYADLKERIIKIFNDTKEHLPPGCDKLAFDNRRFFEKIYQYCIAVNDFELLTLYRDYEIKNFGCDDFIVMDSTQTLLHAMTLDQSDFQNLLENIGKGRLNGNKDESCFYLSYFYYCNDDLDKAENFAREALSANADYYPAVLLMKAIDSDAIPDDDARIKIAIEKAIASQDVYFKGSLAQYYKAKAFLSADNNKLTEAIGLAKQSIALIEEIGLILRERTNQLEYGITLIHPKEFADKIWSRILLSINDVQTED